MPHSHSDRSRCNLESTPKVFTLPTMTNEGHVIHREDTAEFPINIRERPPLRWLEFGDGAIQSIIDLKQPGHLPSTVARAMLAGLLFVPAPQQVLLLGGGGGARARYFHHRHPACGGVAVERSEVVTRLARRFFEFPAQGSGWALHEGDARDFVRTTNTTYDLIMMDIAEGLRSPRWLTDGEFLHHCRGRLSAQGMLVINLMVDNADDFAHTLSRIRRAFDLRTVCLSVPGHKNIIVFGFNAPPRYRNAGPIQQRLPALERKWGLEFGEFFQRMRNENPENSGVF